MGAPDTAVSKTKLLPSWSLLCSSGERQIINNKIYYKPNGGKCYVWRKTITAATRQGQ